MIQRTGGRAAQVKRVDVQKPTQGEVAIKKNPKTQQRAPAYGPTVTKQITQLRSVARGLLY